MNTETDNSTLVIHTDGGARGNPGPAAIGYIIESPSGEILKQQGTVLGETTNNTAEYQAVIHSLTWIKQNLVQNPPTTLSFYLDSNLVVNQVLGVYKIKEPHLQNLASQIHTLLKDLKVQYTFTHIPRAQNSVADKLVNQALDSQS